MARTARQIANSLGQAVQASDPTADLAKGPVFDLLIAPVAPELAVTEQAAEDLRTLASLQLDRVVTLDEIQAIGTSFGLPQIDGRSATVQQTFYTTTRPTSDLVIQRGSIVGTTDGSRLFQTVESATILAASVDQYYVASRRRYELIVACQALAIGTAANLPAFRITRLITRIAGFDGTENRQISQGGTDRQSFTEYLNRIRRKFIGLTPETGGGLISQIFESAPNTITDVSLVYPKDRSIFRRDTGRPAIDAYIIGEDIATGQQRYAAVGGETAIRLERSPVESVTLVQLDGTSTAGFALVPDPDARSTGTARATDMLVLTVPLVANQIVDISYQYDGTVYDLQVNGFDQSLQQFGTDILIRKPVVVPVAIEMDITVLSSFDTNRVSDAVQTKLFSFIESSVFLGSLLPEVIVQAILNDVAGVSSVRLLRFAPSNKAALAVEAIVLTKNEISMIDQANLSIRTHQ